MASLAQPPAFRLRVETIDGSNAIATPSLSYNTTKKPDQCGLLCVAAKYGDIETMQQLLKNGTNVDAKDESGMTALHIACYKGRFEAV